VASRNIKNSWHDHGNHLGSGGSMSTMLTGYTTFSAYYLASHGSQN